MSTQPLAIRDRMEHLIEGLSKDLFEKGYIVRMVLLSALSGQSVFLLGPPGVAKSMIARRLKYAFKDAKVFEYLMGKFSTPDEVFGPVSISKLKDEDKYERLTDAYLPGANIVFLDEIWKASPPIQNALLTVLNEKVYRNGAQEIQVQLRALIAASNELPMKGEGLEALWDRFLLRLLVDNIVDEKSFEEMLLLPSDLEYVDMVEDAYKITDEEYLTWRRHIGMVLLPNYMLGFLTYLRQQVNLRNVEADPDDIMYVSDRRWRKISMLLRAAAFLNGRDEVQLIDAFVVGDCLWNVLSQRKMAYEMVLNAIAHHGYRRLVPLIPIRNELETLREEIEAETFETSTEEVDQIQSFTDANQVTYYSLTGFFGETDGFIRASDWERLNPERGIHVPVLEQTGSNFRAFHTFNLKKVAENQVENKGKTWTLTTEQVERTVQKRRQPSPQLTKIWDSQIQLLISNCEAGLKKLEERRLADEPNLLNHLFVPAVHAQTVRESLATMTEELLNLRLEIKKTRHLYAAMEKS